MSSGVAFPGAGAAAAATAAAAAPQYTQEYIQADLWTAFDQGNDILLAAIIRSQSSQVDVNATDLNGRTPLMLAVVRDRVECLRALLERPDVRVHVNDADPHGRTPVMMAALTGRVECLRALLWQPAVRVHVNDADPDGWTPVMRAANGGHVGCLRALLDVGARTIPLEERQVLAANTNIILILEDYDPMDTRKLRLRPLGRR